MWWNMKKLKKKKINKVLLNQNIKLRFIDKMVLIILAITFSITMVTTIITIKQSKDNQKKIVRDSMELFSIEQKRKFEDNINNKIEILQYISSFKEIYGMNVTEQKKFIEGRSELIGFRHIFIVNTEGIGYYIDEDVFRKQKDEQFFNDIISNDIFITKPFVGEGSTNNIFVTLCVSLYNEENQKVGVLCGAINLFDIQNIFSKGNSKLDIIYSLVDRNGYYMVVDNTNLLQNKVSIYNTKKSDVSLIKRAFDQQTTLIGTVILDGVEYQACTSYLDMYDWVLIIALKTDVALKNLNLIDKYRFYNTIFNLLLIVCIIRIIMCWYSNNKKMNTDILTKCSSRVAIESLLERLDNNKKYNISVIYLDLNKFKEVNDTYGHDVGDKVLSSFSNALLSIFANCGFVGRVGGDEFLCILIDASEPEILELINRLNLILKEESYNFDFDLSFSYGIAFRKKGNMNSINETIKEADKNMYEYKKSQNIKNCD